MSRTLVTQGIQQADNGTTLTLAAETAVNAKADHGAVGNGVANDTAAIGAAETAAGAGGAVYFPPGAYNDTRSHFGPTRRYFGEGYTVDTNNRRRARYFSTISAKPARGNISAFDEIFNGDWSGCHFPMYHRVTGANTAWDAADAFSQFRELAAHFIYLRNEAGYGGTNPNDGAAVVAMQVDAIHAATVGKMYTGTYWGGVTIGARDASNTNCFQNACAGVYSGQVSTTVPGVFLNPVEINCDDQGNDVACVGYVMNLIRNAAASGTYTNAFWTGFRPNSSGTQDCDVAFGPIGRWRYGLDFTLGTFSQAAIALLANQRIYFDATAGTQTAATSGDTSIRYNSATSRLTVQVDGTDACLQVDSGGAWLPSGAALKVNGVDVVKGRVAGWAAATNTKSRATFDTTTVTTAQLAQRVGQLIDDLITHGLIGT